MASAFMPDLLINRVILSAPYLVLVKMSAEGMDVSLRMCVSSNFLFSFSTRYIFWVMVSAVEETGVISICVGLERSVWASFVMMGDMVAEKNRDCLLGGNFAIIFFIS